MSVENYNLLLNKINEYNKKMTRLQAYNRVLNDADLFNIDDKSLNVLNSDLRKLIADTKLDDFPKKTLITGIIYFILVSLIDIIFLKNLLSVLIVVPIQVFTLLYLYIKPIVKFLKEKKKLELDLEEAVNNTAKVSRELDKRLSIANAIDVPYVVIESASIIKSVDINEVINNISINMSLLPEDLLNIYYEKYKILLSKYYSLNNVEGEQGLIDLNIELQELLRNGLSIGNDNFKRERTI